MIRTIDSFKFRIKKVGYRKTSMQNMKSISRAYEFYIYTSLRYLVFIDSYICALSFLAIIAQLCTSIDKVLFLSCFSGL